MRVTIGWLGAKGATALGLGMLLAALSSSAWAGPQFAPEIDPGSMAGALTLLFGGMLMIAGRRRRQ
jgi:hypothetical protein